MEVDLYQIAGKFVEWAIHAAKYLLIILSRKIVVILVRVHP
jgi:hypothetical protein